jgi:hypothetical protein
MKKFLPALCATTLLTMSSPANAQQPSPPEKPATAKPAPAPAAAPAPSSLMPLRVRFVLSKYQGDKKISSLPYDLSVNAGGPSTQLRIGGDVPYRAASKTPNETAVSFNFRTVGTSIDCTAALPDGGLFRLSISVSDDSVIYADQQAADGLVGIPRFRTFRVSNTLLLRDGQTSQMTTATDPISGEVMRVDVTLTVLK